MFVWIIRSSVGGLSRTIPAARSFGINHTRIERESDIDELFASADLEGTINLIEILLDKNAFPTYLSSR